MKIRAIKIKTNYWLPGTDYIKEITDAVEDITENGDVITISEKAISTAEGLIVDESKFKTGLLARLLTNFWMRKIWGGPLGKAVKLKNKTLLRLKNFPKKEGGLHKQVTLGYTGFFQSLRHYSEGGIDASNLPYSYVSLPLKQPDTYSNKIKEALMKKGKIVSIMIVDGDTTYTFRNLHLSPRKVSLKKIIHFGGFITFVLGRILGLKSRSTPISFTSKIINPDLALTYANIAHRVRGYGAGRNVWEMSERFKTDITSVTWNMLRIINHYPIVILRTLNSS